MAESWFALSAEDQKEALAVAAAESGWPANLLEKDIWVVWALQTLGAEQQLLETLTFKGGTSLSKAYGLIDRFSEDVDLTLNIQHLWPEVDLSAAVNPSQADKRRKAADRKLKQWVREIPMPLLQAAVELAGVAREELRGELLRDLLFLPAAGPPHGSHGQTEMGRTQAP